MSREWDPISLRQHIEALMLAHQRAHDAAESDMNRRLEQMNQFRAQIERERGGYVTRPLHDQLASEFEKRLFALEARVAEQGQAYVSADAGKAYGEQIRDLSSSIAGLQMARTILLSLFGLSVTIGLAVLGLVVANLEHHLP